MAEQYAFSDFRQCGAEPKECPCGKVTPFWRARQNADHYCWSQACSSWIDVGSIVSPYAT